MTESTESTESTASNSNGLVRTVVIAALIAAAFFGAYRFASARNGQSSQGAAPSPAAAAVGSSQAAQGSNAPDGSGGAGAGGGCACCGGSGAPTENGVTGTRVEGTASVAGDIQAIAVEVGTTYSPNVIKLKAGVPAEITFGQGAGCTAEVVSQDLGFAEDLTAGPKTVKLGALPKGTYAFSCGMSMVFGQIVVE